MIKVIKSTNLLHRIPQQKDACQRPYESNTNGKNAQADKIVVIVG